MSQSVQASKTGPVVQPKIGAEPPSDRVIRWACLKGGRSYL
jgi:hypothetical protein